jgi:sulfur transfer protein SufE
VLFPAFALKSDGLEATQFKKSHFQSFSEAHWVKGIVEILLNLEKS